MTIDRDKLREAARIVSKWPVSRQAMLGPPPGPFRRFASKEPEMKILKDPLGRVLEPGVRVAYMYPCVPSRPNMKNGIILSIRSEGRLPCIKIQLAPPVSGKDHVNIYQLQNVYVLEPPAPKKKKKAKKEDRWDIQ